MNTAFNFSSKNTSTPSFDFSNNGTPRVGFNLGGFGTSTETNTTLNQPTSQFNFGSNPPLVAGTTGPNPDVFRTFSSIASSTSSGFNFGSTGTTNSANGIAGNGFKLGEFSIRNIGNIDTGFSIGLDET